jgi:hypothetical protein
MQYETWVKDLEVAQYLVDQPDEADVDEKKGKNRKSSDVKIDFPDGLGIIKLPSASTKFDVPELANQYVIPKHPFSAIAIGSSGSGKSTIVLNLILNPKFYGGYFDDIILYSTTGKTDNLFSLLNLEDKNVITTNMVSHLDNFLKKRKKEAESKGPENLKKVLLIFEDISSNKEMLKANAYKFCYTANRHMGLSVISCGHKLRVITRVCRINSNALFILPTSYTDMDALVQDFTPAGMTKNDFLELIEFATTKDNPDDHPFLYINQQDPDLKRRYRKRLDTILELN